MKTAKIVPSNEDFKCSRQFLGVYAEYAGIDFFEATRLMDLCETKRQPKDFDLGVLNASFGLATIFTLIPTDQNKNNPKILESV